MAQKNGTSYNFTRNRTGVLILGIIITAACALGFVYQLNQYILYSDGAVPRSGGAAAGAGFAGPFMRGITSWNHSSRAMADRAKNIAVFMALGMGLGVILIIASVREAQKPVPQPPVHYDTPYVPVSVHHTESYGGDWDRGMDNEPPADWSRSVKSAHPGPVRPGRGGWGPEDDWDDWDNWDNTH